MSTTHVRWIAGVGVIALAGVLAACSDEPAAPVIPTDLPADATNVVYLHHSVGMDIWNGGVADAVADLGEVDGSTVNIVERHFPHDPYPANENDPYDYWKLWVDSSGDEQYEGQETLEQLTEAYDVVVWKNCFLAADLEADTGDPDVASDVKTVENHKLQFEALRDKMHEFPDTKFIVWTQPPKVEGETNEDSAQRAHEFAEWSVNEWDEPGDNIFLWDYHAIATGGEGIYLPEEYAAGEVDSHPNGDLAKKAAPLFAARLGSVLGGTGDETSLTGE